MTSENDLNTERSRRRFLGRSVVVGGVAGAAWVAPTIFTVEAAAAGTDPECCTLGSVDLLATPFIDEPNLYNVGGPYTTGFGTDLSFEFWPSDEQDQITNTPCLDPLIHGIVTACELAGISTGQIPLVRRADAGDQELSVTMTFDPPVSQLKFTVTNIDENVGPSLNYRNAIRISWAFVSGDTDPVLTLGDNLEIVGNEIQIIVPKEWSGPTDPLSPEWNNLEVDFGCVNVIKSVTVTSLNFLGPGTSSTEGRAIGVADIQLCAPVDP